MLGHKTGLDTFKEIEILSAYFPTNIQYETRYRVQEKNGEKTLQTLETKQHATKQPMGQ